MAHDSPADFPFFCPATPGLEEVLKRELLTLGIKPLREDGGFFWKGSWRELYRASLCLRTAGRILLRVRTFQAETFAQLEAGCRDLAWDRYVDATRKVRVRVSCKKSKLYHQGAVEERVVQAIVQKTGATAVGASLESDEDDEIDGLQLFLVRIEHDRCTVSVDTSGELLTRRGYRKALGKAPMRETLAAAVLHAGGWVPAVEEGLGRGAAFRYKAPTTALVDPFCGSGTIPIEAALIARKIPPGMANSGLVPREYSFQRWPFFEVETWDKTVESLRRRVLDRSPVEIRGSDRDAGSVEASRANAERAGVASDVEWTRCALTTAAIPKNDAFLVTNPPYGVRVSESTDLRDLYATFGRLANEAPDVAFVWLCAEATWERATLRSWTAQGTFRNGGIEVRILSSR